MGAKRNLAVMFGKASLGANSQSQCVALAESISYGVHECIKLYNANIHIDNPIGDHPGLGTSMTSVCYTQHIKQGS